MNAVSTWALPIASFLLAVSPGMAQESLFDEASALHAQGKLRESVAAFQAVGEAEEDADSGLAARARNNACVILMDLGDYHAAQEECRHALRIRRGLGDEVRLARVLNNLGLALRYLGNYREARVHFEEALELNRRIGAPAAEVINLANLGGLAGVTGEYGRALELHAAAAELAERHGEEPWASRQRQVAHINQGVILERLGAYEEALELYRAVLAEPSDLDPRRQAALKTNLGVVYRNLGDPIEAAKAYREAAAIYRQHEDVPGLSNALLNLGLVLHLNLGEHAAAEDAYRRALELARRSGDRNEEIQDLLSLGRLLLETDRLEAAEEALARCLELAVASGSADGRWSALAGLGRVAWSRGDLAAALELFQESMTQVERARTELAGDELRSDFFGDKRHIFAAAVQVLALLAEQGPSSGYEARALEVVQHAKERSFLDALGSREEPAEPLSSDDLIALVGDDVLLEYFVAEPDLFVWILGQGGLEMRNLGPADPILATVDEIYSGLTQGSVPGELIDGVSQKLLGVLAERRAELEILRVAPDGRLHYLPFEILRLPNRASGTALVDDVEVSYVPSASTLAGIRQREPTGADHIVGLGNPRLSVDSAGVDVQALLVSRFRLQPLDASTRELAVLGRWLEGEPEIFIDEEATEEAFRQALGRGARVVHLATHAVLDERAGQGAAIVLTRSGEDDGLLYPGEIAALEHRVDLAVLAACRTAGESRAEGRALASLTGSFLAAGTSAVLATLWDVGDEATAAFMDQFYFQLGRGFSPARALRRTKERLRRDPQWRSSSRWAAYVLIGEAPPLTTRWRIPTWSWVLVAILLGVLVARRRRRRRT